MRPTTVIFDEVTPFTDDDLPGMWERADFEGGLDVVRGPADDDEDIDLDAELEALFAEGFTFDRRNRAQRRAEAKNRTRFETSWQGRRLRWSPTQVPAPVRIAAGRRRAKAARRARRNNRA